MSSDALQVVEIAPGSGTFTYKSASGRAEWLSIDPIAEEGGINLYGYVGNRPTRFTDTTGNIAAVDDLVVGGLIVVGAAVVYLWTTTDKSGIANGLTDLYNKIRPQDLDDDGEYDPAPIPTPKSPARPGVRPVDCPVGTIPIDQDPRTKDDVHGIKDGLKGDGVGPDSWIGITPGGDIIVTNPNGSPEKWGPFQPHLLK